MSLIAPLNAEQKERLRNTILGALVADAAAVGLHWLYDQKRIADVAPNAPEFRQPTLSDYDAVLSFFAHEHKTVGDFSHYGEQLMVMLRSLVTNEGIYNKAHYEESFQQHFGYGGKYVGYIDRPTRDTLDNIARVEHEAVKRAKKIPFEGADGDSDSKVKNGILTKVLAHNEKQLQSNLEKSLRTIHDDDNLVAYALEVLEELKAIGEYHGADDVQLPAISKLPALVAVHFEDPALNKIVESAVRVTNNNDLAVHCGQSCSSILKAVIQGTDVNTAVNACLENSEPDVSKLLTEALSLKNEDNLMVTSKFGLSCYLVFGIPSLIHNLVTAESYREAIRKNIYAAGDSCGRAILLGAVLGAQNGVGGEQGIPPEWIEQLAQKDEIDELLQKLFG